MPAYLIGLIEVTDAKQYSQYTQRTPEVIAKFGGRFIARGGKTVTLEGTDEKRRVVILEFPDLRRAREFYHSEEYQQVKGLRQAAAGAQFILVEGCSDFQSQGPH